MNNPKFQITNPPYRLHGFRPQAGVAGHVMFEFELPNLPPIKVELYFDRQQAEKLIDEWRKTLNVAKGLKVDGTPTGNS